MKVCKKCGSIARCYTFKDGLFEAESQVECSKCENKTSKHYAFWASDAADEAREEWERMN